MADVPVPVRLASPDDAATLARLLWDFNREYDEEVDDIEVLEARIGAALRTRRAWAVVAGEPVVGFATVMLRESSYSDGPVALLEDLYVRPDERGRGIGAAMMELLFEHARSTGVAVVEVNVDEPDVDALRFYERHGYVHRDAATDSRAFYLYRMLEER